MNFTQSPAEQDNPFPQLPHPRALAHLGDAVYELHVREQALKAATAAGTDQLDWLHQYTIARVSGVYQANLLEQLTPQLSEAENALAKRGRNLPVSANKRPNQAIHRAATALEVLIGYWYLYERERLALVWALV